MDPLHRGEERQLARAKLAKAREIASALAPAAVLLGFVGILLTGAAVRAALPLALFLLIVLAVGLQLVGMWRWGGRERLHATLNRASTVGSDLGTALLSGVLIASAVLVLELQSSLRSSEQEQARERRALRQQTVLTLALEEDLSGADLSHLDLTQAFLRGKDFFGATFVGTDLSGADLSDSNLVAADLSRARLRGTNLTGVVWSSRTRWPSGMTQEIRARSTFIDLHPERDALVRIRYAAFLPVLEGELTSGETLFAVDFSYGVECGWSPRRPVYRFAGDEGQGTPDIDFVTFNSLVDTPSYGDERAFMDAKPASIQTSGGFLDRLAVVPGDIVRVRVYFHNDANVLVNGEIPTATGTTVRMQIPEGPADRLCLRSWISSDTAEPSVVSDTVEFVADRPVRLEFVTASARIHTTRRDDKLPGSLLEDGTLIGVEQNNGVVPGNFQNDGIVSVHVRVLEG